MQTTHLVLSVSCEQSKDLFGKILTLFAHQTQSVHIIAFFPLLAHRTVKKHHPTPFFHFSYHLFSTKMMQNCSLPLSHHPTPKQKQDANDGGLV